MSTRLDRHLTRLYRLAGAALFLVLCGHASYTAGARHREGTETARAVPACSPAARTAASLAR